MAVSQKEIEDAVYRVETLAVDNESTADVVDELTGRVEALEELAKSLVKQVALLTCKVEQLEDQLE